MNRNVRNIIEGYMRCRMLTIGILCFSLGCSLHAQNHKPKQTDSRIHLIHSDVLYKTPRDPRAEILVGNVKLSHEGVFLDCDSARFYREDNSFDAYGHVKMVQGDTLSLVGDSLFYDGFALQAHARGEVVLIHHARNTKTLSSRQAL